MGQKVHPTGIRLGIIKKHTSVWYADSGSYADKLLADIRAREYIQRKLAAREQGSNKREPRKPRTLEVRIAETCRELIDAIQKSDAPQFDADKVLQNLRAVCTLVS